MALSTSFGYEAASSSLNVSVPVLDYKDFSPRKVEATEVELTNMTSPVDQPETLRFAITPINNVYQNTGVDPAYYGASRKGFSVLVQLNDILRVTDSVKPEFVQDFPVSAHIVIRGASSQYVSSDNVYSVVKRLVAALTPGTDTSARLNELIRGALMPQTSVTTG